MDDDHLVVGVADPPLTVEKPFSVTAHPEGDTVVLVVVGRFGLRGVLDFLACAEAALRSTPRLVADLAGVSAIDLAGLNALLTIVGVGGDVVIRAPSKPVRDQLAISGITAIVSIETTGVRPASPSEAPRARLRTLFPHRSRS
jgi:anti-anti-sigma regulatory factor